MEKKEAITRDCFPQSSQGNKNDYHGPLYIPPHARRKHNLEKVNSRQNPVQLECHITQESFTQVSSQGFENEHHIPLYIAPHLRKQLHLEKGNCRDIPVTSRYISTDIRKPSEKFIQKRSNFEHYCLICNDCIIETTYPEHFRNKTHIINYNNVEIQNRLEYYFNFWREQPNYKKRLQTFFNPHSQNAFVCVACNEIVSLEGILIHPCPSTQHKYKSFEVPEPYRKFEMKYYKEIVRNFFPPPFLEITETVLSSKMPLGMIVLEEAACFLCGNVISNNLKLWYKHILDHCCNMDQMQIRLSYILQYHEFWQERFFDLQMFMVHYVPNFCGAMKCKKQHIVSYDDAFEHILKCPIDDWKILLKVFNVTNKTKLSLRNKIGRIKSFIIKNSCDNSESDDGIVFAENADAKQDDELFNEVYIKPRKTTKQYACCYSFLDSYLTNEIDKLVKFRGINDILKERKITKSDNKIINDLYPDICVTCGSHSYFVQKRSMFEMYCLLCNIYIIDICSIHYNSAKHQKKLKKYKPTTSLKLYHNYWMEQPPDKQLLQIYFNPHNKKSFVCVVCKGVVNIQDAIAHSCLSIQNIYKQYEVSEEYKKFKMKYDLNISKTLFPWPLRKVIKIVLNSEIPLCLFYKKHIVCLICGKARQNSSAWFQHIIKHCSNIELFYLTLPHILEYHQFWEEQFHYMQMLMVHYVPHSTGTMQCTNQHTVAYDKAFQHLATCSIQNEADVAGISKKNVHNVGISSVENEEDDHRFYSIPNRLLFEIAIFAGQNYNFYCKPCFMNFSITLSEISSYCTTRNIIRNNAKKHKLRKYHCSVCKYTSYNKFTWFDHLSSEQHELLCVLHLHHLQNYDCSICGDIIFGDKKTALIYFNRWEFEGKKEPELMDLMMDYPKDILMAFYPDELMKQIHTKECLKMFTIQRLLQNTQCLLCRVLLTDIATTTKILEHVTSNEHQLMIGNVYSTKLLVEYHKFWMKQEDVIIQLKQQFFRPYNQEMMQCLKCLRTYEFDHIIQHSDKNCQDTSSHDGTSSFKNLQIANGSNNCSQDSTSGSANVEECDGPGS